MQCKASLLLARMRQLKLYNRLLHELSSRVILPFAAETTSKKQAWKRIVKEHSSDGAFRFIQFTAAVLVLVQDNRATRQQGNS